MKKLKISLIVLALLVALIAALVWWQFGNIKMAYFSYKFDNTQIDDLIKKQNEDVDSYLKEHGEYNVRPSTRSEQKLHQKNLITDEEFVQILTGKTEVKDIFGFDVTYDESKGFVTEDGTGITSDELLQIKEANKSGKASGAPGSDTVESSGSSRSVTSDNKILPPSGNGDKPGKQSGNEASASGAENVPSGSNRHSSDSSQSQESDSNDEISSYVAQMYVLKSNFESQLDSLYGEAVSMYKQMSASEKKNAKSEIAKALYSKAVSLESECDSQVSEIMSNLTAALEAGGGDTTIVDKINEAYSQEKSLKKAYYLNLVK